jgi:hypothetical protein
LREWVHQLQLPGAGQYRSRVLRKCIIGTPAGGQGSKAVDVACLVSGECQVTLVMDSSIWARLHAWTCDLIVAGHLVSQWRPRGNHNGWDQLGVRRSTAGNLHVRPSVFARVSVLLTTGFYFTPYKPSNSDFGLQWRGVDSRLVTHAPVWDHLLAGMDTQDGISALHTLRKCAPTSAITDVDM